MIEIPQAALRRAGVENHLSIADRAVRAMGRRTGLKRSKAE
jgi:hypothetical protein